MKILLLGKNGQLGWELQRSLTCIGDVVALDRFENHGLSGDLTNFKTLSATIDKIKPDVIVNAAAYTSVDKAETDEESAELINAIAPRFLAEKSIEIDALLVHYSTDYVFDGKQHLPWSELDIAKPINVYGKTKLNGEKAIQESGCKHLIFRTSWVYGSKGENFIKAILRLSKKKEVLSIVNDQIGAPTSAALLADCTAHAIYQSLRNTHLLGLYHLTANNHTSWYEYANLIVDYVKKIDNSILTQKLLPISTSDYVTQAHRPLNSRLDTSKFRNNFNLYLPEWNHGVIRVLNEIYQK